MNLKPDTFKVWEPKIIGIVLIFPVELSKSQGFLCLTLSFEEEGEERKDNDKER